MRSCGRSTLRVEAAVFRGGVILIITMWIVFFLGAMVLVFARSMRVEAIASGNSAAWMQADAVERGGEQFLVWMIDQQKDAVLDESEETFQAVPVGGGYFWIVKPNYEDEGTVSFGVQDEAAKVNLNTAPEDVLLLLPGMTQELADGIIDWRDSDSEITGLGAENEYYLALDRPYYCKNAPLETVEELLLIKNSSPDMLYGRPQTSSSWTTGITSAQGLFDYVTVYTVGPNTDASGVRRVNINDSNRGALANLLRQVLGAARADAIMSSPGSRPPFRSIFDFYTHSGMSNQEFQLVADRITTSAQASLRGLININTASREVLLCLPGLDENDVSNLIGARSSPGTDRSNLAWVAEVLKDKAGAISSLITARSYQYSAQIVAASSNGRAFKGCRVVIDARYSPPRIVYRRDVTEHGWPMDGAILTALRNGKDPMGVGSRTIGSPH